MNTAVKTLFTSQVISRSKAYVLIFLGLLLFCQFSAKAQNNPTFISFQGQAIDEEALTPMAFTRLVVFIDEERICDALTDENGHFSVELPSDLPFKIMTVKVKGERYFSCTKTDANTNDFFVCSILKFEPDSSPRMRSKKRKDYYCFGSIGCPSF